MPIGIINGLLHFDLETAVFNMTQKSKNYRDPSESERRAIYDIYSLLYDNKFFTQSKKISLYCAAWI